MAPSLDMAGIANLGQQLAMKLVAYEMGTSYSGSDIYNMAEDIFATAMALDDLRGFLAADACEVLPVYKHAGREAIEDLATRCGKVYTAIIRTVYRASLAAKVVEDVDFEALGPDDLKASRLIAIRSNMKWSLVSSAFEASEIQLRWLKSSLLLHLQVANIARLQNTPRAPGSFDDELALRALAVRMLSSKVRATKAIIEDIERKERLALADKSDTESIASGAPSSSGGSSDDDTASWKSGKTAHDSKAPSICGDKSDEKANVPPAVEPIAPPPPPYQQPSGTNLRTGPLMAALLISIFKSMGKWVKGLFGRNSTPCLDDLELEATILKNRPSPEIFMAFEPKMLRLELKRILKRGSSASPDVFLTQDNQLRIAVLNALLRAQSKDGRVRQLITVDLSKEPDVAVVFMSVEPALEPVHMTDMLGRKYDIPYELCRSVQRFKDVNRLWPIVRDGAFEIVAEDDTVVTPEAWFTTIKPGAILKMRISAFNDGGINGGVPLPPGAPQPLTWAEPFSVPPPPGWRGGRPPGPPGIPTAWGCFPPKPQQRMGMPAPRLPMPPVVTIEPPGTDGYELGFELDFGPPLTREKDFGEDRKNLGQWVALWTNATDTDFTTDAGGIPSYDDASSIWSGSSSSSDEIIDD
ncbi:uncharacterized protein ColSpa_09288 [Colletotrichum spaethianum]|uniref:Ubiquitin-like domain-containing protein n=1 Tax=Colletotrichum spaethianum TaxID=700344 RepID=A0AA37PBE3_9PEZI|nr:uncharacterized protein ColSpa_09288 [Colletotrichum spaethianum]GKT49107.1 hypothetical protein ColSpa_09288 [Colletotrichum spaethianum]